MDAMQFAYDLYRTAHSRVRDDSFDARDYQLLVNVIWTGLHQIGGWDVHGATPEACDLILTQGSCVGIERHHYNAGRTTLTRELLADDRMTIEQFALSMSGKLGTILTTVEQNSPSKATQIAFDEVIWFDEDHGLFFPGAKRMHFRRTVELEYIKQTARKHD